MKNFTLIILLALLAACSAPETAEKTQTNDETEVHQRAEQSQTQVNFIDVDPVTFAAKMEGNPGILLDVRTPEEVAEGKLAGSKAINYNDDNFAEALNELDPNQPVYVYCAAGGRSSKTATLLGEKGFTLVYNLDGGITAWEEAGLPTEK
jgi:phage shock protein E